MKIGHKGALLRSAALASLLVFTQFAWAQEAVHTDIGDIGQGTGAQVFPTKRPYSPWAGRNFPVRPLFGDTHLHSALSFDAGAAGVRGLDRARPTVSPRGKRSSPTPDCP